MKPARKSDEFIDLSLKLEIATDGEKVPYAHSDS